VVTMSNASLPLAGFSACASAIARAVAAARFAGRQLTLVVCLAVLSLAGCSSTPKDEANKVKDLAPTTEPLAEYMSRAQVAEATEGGRERARLIYRDAAQAYPADKRPWLRLAQSYFDFADYGNAVLAAQEVVQRDPGDHTAQGVLAVSGLRISTAALSALRSQNNLVGTPARTEAESMARNLRSLLGESVLVPRANETAETVAPPKPKVRPRVRVRRSPEPQAAPAVPAAAPAPSNPFGALK
jgi:outer membrane murein-binding lipoprotein Lpp